MQVIKKMCDMWEDQWPTTSYAINILSCSLGGLFFFFRLNPKEDGLACAVFLLSVILEIILIFFGWLFKICHTAYIVSLLDVVAFPTVEIMQILVIVNIGSGRTNPNDFFMWLKILVLLLGIIYRVPRTIVLWTKAPNKCIRNLLSILLCTAVCAFYILGCLYSGLKDIFQDPEEKSLNIIQ